MVKISTQGFFNPQISLLKKDRNKREWGPGNIVILLSLKVEKFAGLQELLGSDFLGYLFYLFG